MTGAPPPPTLRAIHAWRLAPQALHSALDGVAAVSGVRIDFIADQVAGLRSGEVMGHCSAFEALSRLLVGSGLRLEPLEEGRVALSGPVTAQQPIGEAQGGDPAEVAWDRFHRTLEEMRGRISKTERYRTRPDLRAGAFHALMEAQAVSYNLALPRSSTPSVDQIAMWRPNAYGLGLVAPDCLYGAILLDGRRRYRIFGRLGAVRILLLQVSSHLYGLADSRPLGAYDLADFTVSPDGRFEIVAGAEPATGNWIRLDPASSGNWIYVRRWLGDWSDDPGELHIEPIEEESDPALDTASISSRIDEATAVLTHLVEANIIGLHETALNATGGRRNVMALLPGTTTSVYGSPASHYALGVYSLAPGEALLVELSSPPSDAAYWGFQLADVWSRAHDVFYRRSSLNMSEASVDADGAVRAVVAHQDPGVLNWIDADAVSDGVIVFRNFRSRHSPIPRLKKLAASEVAAALPDAARVDPAERRASIMRRRAAHGRFFGYMF